MSIGKVVQLPVPLTVDNGNTDQLSNWISLENYEVQPGLTFSIPSDGTTYWQVYPPVNSGVSSFSLLPRCSPEPDP